MMLDKSLVGSTSMKTEYSTALYAWHASCRKAEKLFGYPGGGLIGCSLSILVPKPYSQIHHELVGQKALEFGSITEALETGCISAQHRKGHTIQGKIKIEEVPGCQMEDQDTFLAVFEPVNVRNTMLMLCTCIY